MSHTKEELDEELDPEVLAALALALPAPAAPPHLRARVLASIEKTGRFEAFAEKVAELIDCALDKARQLVALIDDATAWKVGPLGTQLIDLPSGPRIAHADAGFIRLPAGTKFPHHRHLGDEVALILQGGYVDSAGRVFRPGDVDAKTTGSEHAFTVFADVDLIQLVVLEKGIEIEGMPGVKL